MEVGNIDQMYRNTPNDSALEIKFEFATNRQTEVHEVPTYDSDRFFCDVGSWLGLLVGMSCLSLVELLAFLYTFVKEKLCCC